MLFRPRANIRPRKLTLIMLMVPIYLGLVLRMYERGLESENNHEPDTASYIGLVKVLIVKAMKAEPEKL